MAGCNRLFNHFLGQDFGLYDTYDDDEDFTKEGELRKEGAEIRLECVCADESRNLIDFKSTNSTFEAMCLDSPTGRGADGFNLKVPDCQLSTEEEYDNCNDDDTAISWHHGSCQERPYGGCNPTPNNFDSYEDCEEIAEPVCKKTVGLFTYALKAVDTVKSAVCHIAAICGFLGIKP
ncbi:unnamed protein product [Psylliodes chrysocephalus]|uniref:BPTI/Kunitz inhibitor domain-containing protein n=1 Tax=Psylliodes chrysocephalus TaxID=3402493 RepID=A0A9P0CGM3_9CUCU|nr:unnamed protein product [Psylliodes chrysocephala]